MKFIFRMIIFLMFLLFLPDPLFAEPNSLDGGKHPVPAVPAVPILKNSTNENVAGGLVTAQRSSAQGERVRKKSEFISSSKPLPSVALPTDWNGVDASPPRRAIKSSSKSEDTKTKDKASRAKAADSQEKKRAPKGFSSLGRPAGMPKPNPAKANVPNNIQNGSRDIDVTKVNIPMPVPKWRYGGDKMGFSVKPGNNKELQQNKNAPREEMDPNGQPHVEQVALPIPPPVTVWPQKDIALAQNKCHVVMNKVDATVKPIKPIRNGACGTAAPLQVLAVGAASLQKVSISPVATMNCEFTARFAKWVNSKLQPLAIKYFNSPVIMIHNVASYSCRHRYNDSARKLSEHALANALDIAGFTLKNGTSISVLKHWPEDGEMSEFLKEVHQSACRHFIVVLGPEANEAHRNHFHFDAGRYKVCN